MKPKFEVGDHVDVTGTSKRSSIKTTYSDIVRVFGEPSHRNGDNSYNQWFIDFEIPDESLAGDDEYDPEIDHGYAAAVLYDWGANADPQRHPTEEFIFNIGAKGIDAPYLVHQLLGK